MLFHLTCQHPTTKVFNFLHHHLSYSYALLFVMIMQSRATQGQANDLEKNDLIIKDKATLLTPPIDAVDPSSQDSVQEGSENGVEDLRSHISDFVARGMMTIGMTGDHIPVATIEPQSAGPSIGPQQMVQDPVACDSNHDIGPITKYDQFSRSLSTFPIATLGLNLVR